MEPEQYDLLYECEQSMWWFVGMRQIMTTLLGSRLRPGLRCLEAGSGTGYNAEYYAREYGWQVFPFDISERALNFTQSRGVGRLVRASLLRLPYRDAAFDCATSMDVLYTQDVERGAIALAELYRVLKPGGFLLLRTAALPWLHGQHSDLVHEAHRYRLGELGDAMEAAGFRVERKTYANCLLLPLAALKRKVLEPLRLSSEEGDVHPVAGWLNRSFLAMLGIENRLIARGFRLPAGVSALALAVKNGA